MSYIREQENIDFGPFPTFGEFSTIVNEEKWPFPTTEFLFWAWGLIFTNELVTSLEEWKPGRIPGHFHGNILSVPCLETLTIYVKMATETEGIQGRSADVSDTTVIVQVTGEVYRSD